MLQQLIQLISIVLFVIGASIYYDIRRNLHKQGYPVSIFVYSGPCWEHYNDLIAKSDPPEQRRLKLRRKFMAVCIILALFLLIFSGFIPGT